MGINIPNLHQLLSFIHSSNSKFSWTWLISTVNSDKPLALNPSHILSEHRRPKLGRVSHSASKIPVIHLAGYVDETAPAPSDSVRQVSHACQHYGLFQIINHGVPDGLCDRVMNERARLILEDPSQGVRFVNYLVPADAPP
uniref:Non-haem dioxygenase N-terminal domain-containing protein n=1 Tax=Kalanchoe fedtschenkoi TaxID=63787 RepID=A0A7N0ZS87_KALFE